MSAVIWCGIVAVWVFVLIPTWVRRGDLHWHRGTAMAAGPEEDNSAETGRRLRVPGRRLLRRSRADRTVEVEAMSEHDAQTPAPERVSTGEPAQRARVAAPPRSSRLTGAVRASFGGGADRTPRKKQPLHVRRARRLVALAALALGTLIAAIFAGGMFIVVNLLLDVALVAYIWHLRKAARERQAQLARQRRARTARQAWDKASATERSSQLDGWSAPVQPTAATYSETVSYTETVEEVYDEQAEPVAIDLTTPEQPALIDLTDAPTEELTTARAS